MIKKLTSALLITSLITGCSAMSDKTEFVSAYCSEDDATLRLNGEEFKGHAYEEVRRGKKIALSCSKSGYYTATHTIDYSFNAIGVADAVGTVLFFVPVLGLFTDGKWSLDETDVTIPMRKKENVATTIN